MFKMRAKMITVGLLGTAAILPLDLAKADQLGHASWYALHSRTASGEIMNPSELTAAHRSLPFGTQVLVENLTNGRSVVVRINDRGPFIGGRIIDLSKAAAASLGMIDTGTAQVRVTATGGGALAALGKATSAKSRAGAGQGLSASADLRLAAKSSEPRPLKTVAKAKSSPAEPVKTRTAKSSSSGKAKKLISQAAPKTKQAATTAKGSKGKVAKSLAKNQAKSLAKGRIKTVVKSTAKSRSSQGRVVSVSKKTRSASKSMARRNASLASAAHVYPILGKSPGFMKHAPAGRAG